MHTKDRDSAKKWRIKWIDELDEQKCTQKIGILRKSDKLSELTN